MQSEEDTNPPAEAEAVSAIEQSDSNETITQEKIAAETAAKEQRSGSTSSSSSIQPLSIDETPKISDLSIQQQQQVVSSEKKDEIFKETFLSENFQEFFVPIIQNLDTNVATLRTSQIELGDQIDLLAAQMRVINENLQKQIDLDEYAKRLMASKKRVNNVLATILAVEERMGKIYNQIKREQQQQQQQQSQEASSK